MKIKKTKIDDRIYLLIFKNQYEITSTLLRFQEYYESPFFRGKIFSLKEFKEWYIKNSPNGKKSGRFTYYTDWNGFNIPSYILKPFYKGKFNPLSQKEKRLLDLFENNKSRYYIVGIHKNMKNVEDILKHETAHGLFYTNQKYKKDVLAILKEFDIEKIKEELRYKGYCEEVLNDEVHAYSIGRGKKIKSEIPEDLQVKLKKIYETNLNKF